MNENTGYEHKLITYTNNFSLNVIICNLFFVCAKSEEVFQGSPYIEILGRSHFSLSSA